jgi:hypothetical protein
MKHLWAWRRRGTVRVKLASGEDIVEISGYSFKDTLRIIEACKPLVPRDQHRVVGGR